MSRLPKIVLPILVLITGAGIAVVIINSRPDVVTEPVKIIPKLVKVRKAVKKTVRLNIYTQGTVAPRTESDLVSQVSGQIIEISPAFASGGFFDKGDVLVRVDESDYALIIIQTRLQVAQAELRLNIEEQEAKVALQEWQRLNTGPPPPLAAREPQMNEARRSLDAANASLEQAKLNLERTKIKAPYTGRVRSKLVDIGQIVNPGMAVAKIYSVDEAEVRLPIPDKDLEFLDFPIDFRGWQDRNDGPTIILRANFAGRDHEWEGILTRIEGEVDPRSRMIYIVAKVEDPYGKSRNSNRPPLTVGMFVHAEIEGKLIDNVIAVPRYAIRNENQVLIVDDESRLRFRDVEVLKMDSETAYIVSGISDGENICITPLNAVVDGMLVEVYQ